MSLALVVLIIQKNLRLGWDRIVLQDDTEDASDMAYMQTFHV